jgi:hypothetical protein
VEGAVRAVEDEGGVFHGGEDGVGGIAVAVMEVEAAEGVSDVTVRESWVRRLPLPTGRGDTSLNLVSNMSRSSRSKWNSMLVEHAI